MHRVVSEGTQPASPNRSKESDIATADVDTDAYINQLTDIDKILLGLDSNDSGVTLQQQLCNFLDVPHQTVDTDDHELAVLKDFEAIEGFSGYCTINKQAAFDLTLPEVKEVVIWQLYGGNVPAASLAKFEAAYPFGNIWRRTWCCWILDAYTAGPPAPCEVVFSAEDVRALGPLSQGDTQLLHGLVDLPVPPRPSNFDDSTGQSWAVCCLSAYLE